MSKFEGLRTKPKNIEKSSKFEGLRLRPKNIKEEEPSPSFLDRAKQFGSGALAGITRAGLLEGADQFGAGVMEVAPGVVAPIQPDSAKVMSESAEKGLDALESMRPDEDDAIGNILYKSGEFGGAVASTPFPGGGAINAAKTIVPATVKSSAPAGLLKLAAKYGAKGINKSYNTLKNPIVEGSLIGAHSGALQQGGVDPLAADITSMLLVPSAIRSPRYVYQSIRHPNKTIFYPTARKMFGINENNFNLRAAEAAERLGVDLNLAELNPSNNIAFTNNVAAKSWLASEGVKLHNKNIDDKVKDILQETLNKVGPKKTDSVEKIIDNKYAKTRALFPKNPEDRMILPNHSVAALRNIKNRSLAPSPSEAAVLAYKQKILDQLAPEAFIEGKKIEGFTPPMQPIDAEILLDSKVSLNSNDPNNIIRYSNPEKSTRNQIKSVGRGYRKDLDQLGEKYPEWHSSLKDADKYFSDVASREKFENALINGGFNFDDFNYQPGMMTRNLNSPKKFKNIKHTYKNKSKTTREQIDKNLEDLGIVSDAIVKRNKSNPNPSGTAAVASNLSSLTPIASSIGSFFVYPNITTAGISGLFAGGLGYGAPKFFYNKVIDNKNLIKDTIDNIKNPKHSIPFKNRLINSRIRYVYPTINNKINDEN